MPAQGVEIEKIHDVAEQYAVTEIAERPSQYQPKARAEKALSRMPREHRDDHPGREHGDADEESPLPTARVREKTERRPAIVREHQVEERGDLARLADPQRGRDGVFARLVGEREQGSERKPRRDAFQARHAKRRGSPGPNRFDTQRPQIPGCLRSLPTSARQCQQRSHLGCLLGAARIASGPAVTSAREVISTKRNSSPRLCKSFSLSPVAAISNSA